MKLTKIWLKWHNFGPNCTLWVDRSGCDEPPITKVPLWTSQASTGQTKKGTVALMLMGCSQQPLMCHPVLWSKKTIKTCQIIAHFLKFPAKMRANLPVSATLFAYIFASPLWHDATTSYLLSNLDCTV